MPKTTLALLLGAVILAAGLTVAILYGLTTPAESSTIGLVIIALTVLIRRATGANK